MEKLTISMAMFNSYVTVYQRVLSGGFKYVSFLYKHKQSPICLEWLFPLTHDFPHFGR